jgi:LysM repeat protein
MGEIQYQVVTGDTLSSIARRYKVTVEELARINGLSDVHYIRAGWMLAIPKPRPLLQGQSPRHQVHQVQAGETLDAIAQRYAISVESLAHANATLDHKQGLLGRKLMIPRVEQPPPAPPRTAALLPTKSSTATLATASSSLVPLMEHKGTPVMAFGRVSNIEGTNFRATPDTRGPVHKQLSFNTRLFVSQLLQGDWYFVILEDGSAGYVYAKYVNIHPPEPQASLHQIKHDEGALKIVKQYYKGDAIQWGRDERYYVNVLVEANRGHNPCGIYNPSGDVDWSHVKTRENYLIWVPSLDFANQLRHKVRSGSLSYELWQETTRVAELVEDALLGGAAFAAGIIHGALESVWDFLAGLVDLAKLAWNLIASILTGELLSDLKHLWELVKKIEFRALAEAGLAAFRERWNAPELLKRWHFRGWMVGYAIAEIVLMFCDGAVVLKWVGKTGKFGKLLEKFPEVAKTLRTAKKAWSSVSEPTRQRLAEALAVIRKEQILKYDRLAEKIRKVYGLSDFERIVARGRQLALKDRQILDFLEMGTITKPGKKIPKLSLTAQELLDQMENWCKVIRPRGYPYLFESLEQFKKFQEKLRKLAKKYKLPEGKMLVQGSALRTAQANDVDVALFISVEAFEAYAMECSTGILGRAKNAKAATRIIEGLEGNTGKGFIPQFLFNRLAETPGVSFERELIDALEGTFGKATDFSLMKNSSELNLYPYLEISSASKTPGALRLLYPVGLLLNSGTRHLPMNVKYYNGLAVDAGNEVTAEAARRLMRYAKAYWDASGHLERVELYTHGRLQRVDYYGDSPIESIAAVHQAYKGVDFTTRRPSVTIGRFNWEEIRSHDASGKMKDVTAVLQDEQQHGLMEVRMGVDGQVREVTKYFWESPNALRYVFEYDGHGKQISVYDVAHGESASFEDIKEAIKDPRFFERGLNLPAEIAGTSIPK